MITARLYLPGKPDAQIVETHEIDALLDSCHLGEHLLWVDLEAPDADEVALVVEEFGVHSLVAEDLLEARQRPKLEKYDSHWLLVAEDCRLTDDREFCSSEVDAVFGESWIVTVRKRGPDGAPVFPVDEVVARFDEERHEREIDDEGYLLYVLLDVVVDRYERLVHALEDQLDLLEAEVFAEDPRLGRDVQVELYQLRGAIAGFRRGAMPLGPVVHDLRTKARGLLDARSEAGLQDVGDHVLRQSATVESLRELLGGILDAHLALSSHRMNRVMKTMTSWGAILLGSTLIAGIYGMNFEHMPELDWRLGYPMALGMMVALTISLYTLFKRRDWL